MATTIYDTVNGKLIGESTGGVTTTYLADELDSVVATAASGAVLNTYRYAPYGQILAKTGLGADPRFLWAGGAGYRNTAAAFAEFYVRERSYASGPGVWTTRDRHWLRERPYAYARCKPVTFSDPSGLSPTRHCVYISAKCSCGTGTLRWAFGFEPAHSDSGWLIQKIVKKANVKDCSGTDVSDPCMNITYYEAWWVDTGKVQVPVVGGGWTDPANAGHNYVDEWKLRPAGCSHGSMSCTGELMFVRAVGWNFPLPGFKPGNAGGVPCALALPSSLHYPFLGQGHSIGSFSTGWGCCLERKPTFALACGPPPPPPPPSCGSCPPGPCSACIEEYSPKSAECKVALG